MPAVVAAPAIIAIAFALAALAAALLINQLVAHPIRVASVDAGGIPVIGGAVAWLLSRLADVIEIGVSGVSALHDAAVQQATGWLNWLVANIVQAYWGWLFAWVQWFIGVVPSTVNDVSWLMSSFVPGANGWFAYFLRVANNLSTAVAWLSGPFVAAVTTLAQWTYAHVQALESAVASIESTWLPWVRGWLENLNGRAGALERWADHVGTQTLPRIEADVSRRALEWEAQALRQRVGQLESQVALLMALGIIALAGTEAISNLRCIMNAKCDPLTALLEGDLEARVTDLEVDHG